MAAADQDMEIFELQADVCAALSNSRRLQILNCIKDREKSVSHMIDEIGINKANMSQHLTILRQKGLVLARRDGTQVFYRLASPRISEACSIMREVLVETLREKERIAHQLRVDTTR